MAGRICLDHPIAAHGMASLPLRPSEHCSLVPAGVDAGHVLQPEVPGEVGVLKWAGTDRHSVVGYRAEHARSLHNNAACCARAAQQCRTAGHELTQPSLTRKGATKPPEAPSTWIFKSQPFLPFSSAAMLRDGTHAVGTCATVPPSPPLALVQLPATKWEQRAVAGTAMQTEAEGGGCCPPKRSRHLAHPCTSRQRPPRPQTRHCRCCQTQHRCLQACARRACAACKSTAAAMGTNPVCVVVQPQNRIQHAARAAHGASLFKQHILSELGTASVSEQHVKQKRTSAPMVFSSISGRMSSGVATRRPSCISTYRSSTSPAERIKQRIERPQISLLVFNPSSHRHRPSYPVHAACCHRPQPAVNGQAHTHSNGRISAAKRLGEDVKGMVSSGSANLRLTGTQPQCTNGRQLEASSNCNPKQPPNGSRPAERPHLPAQVRLRSSGKQVCDTQLAAGHTEANAIHTQHAAREQLGQSGHSFC